MDLTTNYLGHHLRNPLVASASPLSYTLDGIRRLADAGVGAIVMFSLFEEQLRERAARVARIVDGPAESFPEALSYSRMPSTTTRARAGTCTCWNGPWPGRRSR